MAATATRTRPDPVQARIQRAQQALAEGAFHIQRTTPPGPGMLRWTLKNGGGKTYEIVYDRDRKEFVCTCPDFENRGKDIGTCKHIEAVKIWERQRRANGKANGTPKPDTNMTAAPQARPDLWALVEALREQNEILREIRKELRHIDIALAQGLGVA